MNRWLTCFALLFCLAQSLRAAERPNVIVILVDDVGWSDLGCYGSEINTPNLDALAAGGVRFTEFYNTARCCPSRAALLTGLYSHQAGVGHMTGNKSGLDGYAGTINDRCVTIAQVLKPAGYDTYALGKWHVSSFTKPEGPKDNWPVGRGFERYYGIIEGAANYFDPGTLTRGETMISPVTDKEYQPAKGDPYYFTNALGDTASRFIHDHDKADAKKPFFMYCAFTADHWPMQALPRDIEKYKGKYDVGYEPIRKARFEKQKQIGVIDPANCELSPQFGEWDKVQNKAWEARCMEVYAASLDCMDQNVGKIVKALKDDGQFDNTLILYMQDNGGNAENTGRPGNTPRAEKPTLPVLAPDAILTAGHPKQTRAGYPVLGGTAVMPGPDDTYIAYGEGWANVSNTPLREYKHFTHEGGIASPLIAHWPNHIARRGAFEKQPSHLIDIMATCVDLAGATYPKQFNGKDITPMQGVSLVPAFDGKPLPERMLFWEHEGNRAAQQGDWKLVAKGPAGAWELYNLATDRSEMHDLASSEPDRLKSMVTAWETWAPGAHVLPWPWSPQYGEAAGPALLKLKADANLEKKDAPILVGKSIRIHATITKAAREGVIIAHGGTASGFSLYLKEGHIAFATRHQSAMTVVASKDALPDAFSEIDATLAKDGAVSISVNGKEVASGKTPGAIATQPADGLQVGKDLKGAVGDYKAPFPFAGEIGQVDLTLGE